MVGYIIGNILSVILFIPSILRQAITGKDPDNEDETLRKRLIMWFERVRTYVLTGEGEMYWSP